MANFIWPIFLLIFGFTGGCRFLGNDYDPNEHTFLCTNNETVAEKLVVDILEAAQLKNDNDFDRLSEELLKDLMVIYRDAVTEMFLQKTCEGHYCHPRLLEDQFINERETRLFGLEISSLELLQTVVFEHEINDLVVTPSQSGKYVVVAHVTGAPVTLLEYTLDHFLQQIEHFTSYPGSCLVASTSRSWKPPVVAASSCHPEDDSKRNYKQNTTYVYVFSMLSRGVEMTQVIEVNLEKISALEITWQRGTPSLVVFGEGSALHHNWNDYNFALAKTMSLPEAYDISTFRYKDETYIILSKFTQKLHPEGVYIYQSLRDQPGAYKLYQRLTTCVPTDTEYFSISNLHFLAVTCFKDDLAYIYWWSETQFLLWQSIQTSNAESWTAIQLINREIILALVEYHPNNPFVRFFHLEDEYFVSSGIEIHLRDHFPGRRIVVSSFNHHTDTILLISGKLLTAPTPESIDQPVFGLRDVSNRLDSLLVYKLHLRQKLTSGDLSNEVEDVRSCFLQLNEKINQERVLMEELDAPPSDWIVTDETQIVTGEKSLVHGLYAEDVVVDNLFLGPTVHLHAEEDFHCQECELQERELSEKLDRLLEEAKDLVLKSEPQTITGKKIIVNDVIVEHRLYSTNIITGTVCNIDLSRLNRTMVRKTGDQVFHNDVVIRGDITTVNIDFVRLVNGIKLQNIATLSGPRHFTAPQIFDYLNVESVEMTGTLNDIHPHDIVIHDVPQEIRGPKIIKGNLVIDGRLNVVDRFYDVDVQYLAKNILTTNTLQEINVDVVFEEVEFTHHVKAGSVLGVDLNNFYQNHLNTHYPQTITGPAHFASDIVVTENVDIAFVNGMDLYRDFLTTNTLQLIPDEITIAGNVTVHGNLNTDFRLHGLDFANDVVTRHGLREITGHKIFVSPVEVDTIEIPHGLVNDVDLSQVGYPVAATTRHVSIEELNVEVINGQSVRDLLNVLRKSGRQHVTGNFVFNDVTMTNIHVHGLVSGKRLDHDFITRATNQVIQQELIFDKYVKVFGAMSFKDRVTINEVDLSMLKMNAVTVHGDQDISGRKIFTHEVHVKENVVVQPGVKFNNVDLSEQLFLVNKNQNIQHRFVAEEIVIHDDVVFQGYINTTTINDVHVSKFFDNVVYIEGDYKIGGVKRFTSNVEITNQLNVNLINGYDLGAIQRKIVRLSTEQTITGRIIHQGTLNLKAATHVERINGVNFLHEISSWARVENGHVRQPIEFTKSVKFEDGVNVISINNLDMETTLKNILSKSRPQNLTYAREIEEAVIIHNLVTPKINNIPLDDLRLTGKTSVITNRVVFHHDIDVSTNLSINTLNDIRLNELFTTCVMKNKEAVITGTKTFTTINAKSVVVNGLFNGLNFSLLPQRLVLRDKPQVISANVHFEHDIVVQEFQANGSVNGIDLSRMLRVGLTKSTRQTITAPKFFSTKGPQYHSISVEDTVEIKDVDVHLIDGVDINVIANEAILQYDEQIITAPIVFQTDVHIKNVHLTKTLNNIRIPQDIALTKGEQKIRGTVTFAPITITYLDVIGKANDVDVNRLLTRRITMSTEQTINRPVKFEDVVTITGDLIVRGRINGLKCSDIMTTNTDQEIVGSKTFVDIEASRGISTDYVNGVHWLVLYNQIEQIINQKWIHYEDVIFNNIVLVGTLVNDGEAEKQAIQLEARAVELRSKTRDYVLEYENWRLASCQCFEELAREVPNLAHYLEYFEHLQTFEYAIDIAVVPFQEEFYLFLLQKPDASVHERCNNLLTYTCTHLPAIACQLVKNQPLPIQNTEIIDFFPGNHVSFLTFQNPSYSVCSKTLSGTFVHVLGKTLTPSNKIDNNLVDAIAILPGFQISLMAIARTGRIDVQQISCNHSSCAYYDEPPVTHFHDGRALTLKWFQMHNVPHLFVLAASRSVSGHKDVLSTIFRWQDDLKLIKSHEMSTISPNDVVTFEIEDNVYLAIGSYDCYNTLESDRLRIYKINDKIEIIQEIAISTRALSIFEHLNETYLMVSHVDRDVFIYRWRGFFGFQFWSRIEIEHPRRVRPFALRGALYIAMAGNGDKYSQSLIVKGKQTDFYQSPPGPVQQP